MAVAGKGGGGTGGSVSGGGSMAGGGSGGSMAGPKVPACVAFETVTAGKPCVRETQSGSGVFAGTRIKYTYYESTHVTHEEADYAKAKELHDESLRYSLNENVTAQALALKALNSYALGDHDDALHLFQEALTLFDEDKPFFNSYFHRNALLFCGAIFFDRKEYDDAASFYRRVSASVSPGNTSRSPA